MSTGKSLAQVMPPHSLVHFKVFFLLRTENVHPLTTSPHFLLPQASGNHPFFPLFV